MIKSYQSFLESKTDIDSICKKYDINNYTINDDGSIDVDYTVDLSSRVLTRLPLKFRNVTGSFYCYDNKLTTLEGCPQNVGGDFYCDHNKLTTLEGCPRTVGGDFDCSHNQLTTLEGCPNSIGGHFYCYHNQLTSLEGCPNSIGGHFYCTFNCTHNQLTSLEGFPEFWEGYFYYSDNPISKILDQFPKDKLCKAIHWINEYDVIQNGEVITDRLEEVYYELGLSI